LLLAVAAMDRQTAEASIVASEMAESAPLEALKAQTMVSCRWLKTPRNTGQFALP
jgi:peptidoglycan hydrolase-like amidase